MCYTEPLLGAAISSLVWQKTKSVKVFWLLLMFCGGAMFGLIDHFWNGELFCLPKEPVSDLLLGAVISVSILIAWTALVLAAKVNPTIASYVAEKKQ